jgi:uncharacterized protein YbjT (DUF2867 family)
VLNLTLGSNIARILSSNPQNKIQLTSRNPHPLHTSLSKTPISASLLSPVAADVTKPSTLKPAFESADVVISLVGILHGTDKQFEEIQWKGAENVAKAARHASAKLVHVSAIGADKNSHISYWRTKALAEEAVFTHCPNATVFRPSLLFGPGDGFFAVRPNRPLVLFKCSLLGKTDQLISLEVREAVELSSFPSCVWRGNYAIPTYLCG